VPRQQSFGCQQGRNVASSQRWTAGTLHRVFEVAPQRMDVIVRGQRVEKKDGGKTNEMPAKADSQFLIRLHLESNPESLCLVRATIQCVTEGLHFPASQSRAIVLSVDEALTNVIRHAYKGRSGQPIEVTCRRLQNRQNGPETHGIEIVLEDSGAEVDPAQLKGRALEEIRPGGLGLHFIRQSMDEVEFSRMGGKNQLRLVKYLAPGTRGSRGE